MIFGARLPLQTWPIRVRLWVPAAEHLYAEVEQRRKNQRALTTIKYWQLPPEARPYNLVQRQLNLAISDICSTCSMSRVILGSHYTASDSSTVHNFLKLGKPVKRKKWTEHKHTQHFRSTLHNLPNSSKGRPLLCIHYNVFAGDEQRSPWKTFISY